LFLESLGFFVAKLLKLKKITTHCYFFAWIPSEHGLLLRFACGNIQYLWLVSEENFWLCAYLDERAEVVQCASSALVGRAYSALENSMLAICSGHRKNARVRLHQLA